MKLHRKIKIMLIGIIVIFVIIGLLINSSKIRFSNESSTFFVWSTGDCNGVYTISGMHTADAIGLYIKNKVYPVDSLDNNNFFGLTYPFQVNNTVYYTTTNTQTGESCIITKTNSDPEKMICTNLKEDIELTYYRKNNIFEYVISKNNNITYKRVKGNKLYYIIKYGALASNAMCEIWCFNLNDKTDELLISNVHHKASFDVDSNGNILYVNRNNEIILWSPDGSEKNLDIGMAACFGNNENILIATDSILYSFSLDDQKKRKICNATGYYMELSLSGTYLALQNSVSEKPAVENDFIQIIDLDTRRLRKIKAAPDTLFGMAWFQEYNPIN